MVGAVAELLLGGPALGDIDQHPFDQHLAVIGRPPVGALVADPDDAPVAGDHPVFDRERGEGVDAELFLGFEPVAVVGVDAAPPQLVVLQPLVRGEAQQALDLRRDVEPAAVGPVLGQIRDDRQALDQPAVARLGLRELIDRRVVRDRGDEHLAQGLEEAQVLGGELAPALAMERDRRGGAIGGGDPEDEAVGELERARLGGRHRRRAVARVVGGPGRGEQLQLPLGVAGLQIRTDIDRELLADRERDGEPELIERSQAHDLVPERDPGAPPALVDVVLASCSHPIADVADEPDQQPRRTVDPGERELDRKLLAARVHRHVLEPSAERRRTRDRGRLEQLPPRAPALRGRADHPQQVAAHRRARASARRSARRPGSTRPPGRRCRSRPRSRPTHRAAPWAACRE